MSTDQRRDYLERDILEADGCRLVLLLYRSAAESLVEARGHLEKGDITERSRSIMRACAILNELASSVDHSVGSELTRNLVELYDYLQYLLHKANAEQTDLPLAEAQRLLGVLEEAWNSCDASRISVSAPVSSGSTAGVADHVPFNITG